MELASTRLSQLSGKISTFHGNMHLDIYERDTSSSLNFNYIEVPHFLDEIEMGQLSDKLMEGKLRESKTWQKPENW